MNRRMPITIIALAMAFVAGCSHAQMPPTVHTVSLTWKATTTGGIGPYTYVASKITVAAGATGCPTPTIPTPNYAPINSASPISGLALVDSSATGSTACYIVQAIDSVQAISQPSNIVGPLVVPTAPAAPQQLGGNITADAHVPQPPLAKPSEGPDAPAVVAKLQGRVN